MNWNLINVLYEYKFKYRKRLKFLIYNIVDLNFKFLVKVYLSNF